MGLSTIREPLGEHGLHCPVNPHVQSDDSSVCRLAAFLEVCVSFSLSWCPMSLYLATGHDRLKMHLNNTCRLHTNTDYLDKPDDPVSPSATAINLNPVQSKELYTESHTVTQCTLQS